MIMPRGQQLLMPVQPVFIVASLIFALALNMLPLGRLPWMPDVLMVTLAFWGLQQPLRVGLGIAFALGLCMDVQQSSLLGQHALSYAVLMFCVAQMQRRLHWYSALSQTPLVLSAFALAHLAQIVIGVLAGGTLPGWSVLLAPLMDALLWAPVSWMLLAPQRQAPERSEKRS